MYLPHNSAYKQKPMGHETTQEWIGTDQGGIAFTSVTLWLKTSCGTKNLDFENAVLCPFLLSPNSLSHISSTSYPL